MFLAAVCLFSVLLGACADDSSSTALTVAVQTQELRIPGERGDIPATLYTPADPAGAPAVVVCHGFTGNRALDGHTAPLAQALAEQGITTLAIDFAGSGESTEPFTAYTPESMQSDLSSAVNYLLNTVGSDPRSIGLLGHSMGGRAVTLFLSSSVRAAALWAPADGTGLAGLEFLDHTAEGRQALYDAAAANGTLTLSQWGVTVSAAFFQQAADAVPADRLRSYTGALLLAYSAQDPELLSQETIDLTRAAAAEHSGDTVDLTDQFADATHNFTSNAGDAADAAVRARIESATADFFAAYLKSA